MNGQPREAVRDGPLTPGPANASLAPRQRQAPEATLLFEDDHTRIEHHPATDASRPSSELLISFDPLLYLWPKPAFALDFVRRLGADVVTVRRKREHFYQALSREVFTAAVAPLLPRYTRVLAYGSSLGAYAALYYGRDLDCTALAVSPRVSVHPEFGTRHWQQQVDWRHECLDARAVARCRALIAYDPREPVDQRYLAHEILRQFPAAEVLRVPFSGHPSTHMLNEIGHLGPMVRALLAGQQPPTLDRRSRRWQSPTWCQVVADLASARGRLPLASRLAERAVELRPRSTLTQRALGRVRTLQGDWAGAVAALEAAAAVDPDDLLTQSMLAHARRGLEGEPAPSALSAIKPPAAALRVDPALAPPPLSGWQRLRAKVSRWMRS
jgi:hypothetical protein